MLSLEDVKNYLRVDFDDDDALIESLIPSATELVKNVARTEDLSSFENGCIAVLFTVAYLYEHREEADHHALTLTLRALLFGERQVSF